MTSPVRPQVLTLLATLADSGELELLVGGQGSMAPLLRAGDRIRVRRQDRYRAGDLLVFRNGAGALVVHRLLGRRWWRGGLYFVLRGDATPAADGLVAAADVVGRVAAGEVPRRTFEPTFRDRLGAHLRYLSYWLSRISR